VRAHVTAPLAVPHLPLRLLLPVWLLPDVPPFLLLFAIISSVVVSMWFAWHSVRQRQETRHAIEQVRRAARCPQLSSGGRPDRHRIARRLRPAGSPAGRRGRAMTLCNEVAVGDARNTPRHGDCEGGDGRAGADVVGVRVRNGCRTDGTRSRSLVVV
jgi:hypothetical protein